MECGRCGKEIPDDAQLCVHCGTEVLTEPVTGSLSSALRPKTQPADSPLAILLVVVGCLDILGGIILCVNLWPGEARSGYAWLAEAYIPAVTWLASGFVAGLFSFAAAAVVSHLKAIREYTDAAETILLRLEATVRGSAKQ
jgi:hypothetical protein